jgi:hypothetical protein
MMKLAGLGLLVLPLLNGCSDKFTDVEMHLGSEDRVRPLAILCDPPEAAPGDTVEVTLLCYSPNPAALQLNWKVALDYDLGRYEADEVERHLVDLDATQPIPRPQDDGQGFLRQTFRYVVPDSSLWWASSLPDPLVDEGTIGLAGLLLPPGPSAPTSKQAVERYLRELSPADLDAMPAETRAAALALADRFACRLRFRATLQEGVVVDVTRCLTVRHSRRLGSPNTNLNPQIAGFQIVGVPHPDIEYRDLPRYEAEVVRYSFQPETEGTPEARVPRHEGWTYFLEMGTTPQTYTSPFSGEALFKEQDTYRWYYFRMDAPGDRYALFRDDQGDATQMWALDEHVRLEPPPVGGESRYRLFGCLRDERPEWQYYQASPGLSVTVGEVVFTAP